MRVSPNEEPNVARRHARSKRERDQPRVIGRQVSGKERDAVASARRSSLRALGIGSKGNPIDPKFAREPFGLGDKITLIVETDERWRVSGVDTQVKR
jgi:hypothetical protein